MDPGYRTALRPIVWMLLVLAATQIIVWLAPPLQGARGIAGYAPLHTLLETVAIVISALVFAVGWGVYDKQRPGNFMLLAVVFLGVALLDFLHALSYQGMPDFITPSGAEKAINFWLAARAFAALGLLAVALPPWRPLRSMAQRRLMLVAVLLSVGMVGWIVLLHQEWLPRTFIAGQGLTAFKVTSEYFLIALYLAAALGFLRKMRVPQAYDVVGLFGAASVMALSEVFFTLYADVTDVFNLLGHVYKVIAYGFIYNSIFIGGVKTPYQRLHASMEALRTSEERWKFALEGAGDGVWDWNMQTGEVVFSKRWREMFGFAEDEAMNQVEQWRTRIHPEDLQRSLADEQAYFDGKTASYVNEHRVQCKDGGWKWILERGMVVSRNADGKPLRMIGTQTDITDRKQVETALLASEERFRGLTQLGADWYWEQDEHFRFKEMSGGIRRRQSIPPRKSIGKTRWELGALNLDEAAWQRHREMLERHESFYDFEIKRLDENGKLVFISVSGEPIFDETGRFTGYRGVAKDITERKVAEEKLRLLARIFESGSEAFLVCDANNQIMTVNRSFTEQTGYSKDEVVGKNPNILSSGLETEKFYAAMWRSIDEIGHWQGEVRDRRKNGEVYPKWLTIDVLKDEQGQITNYIASFSDITEQKRADEKIHYLAHHDTLTGLPNRVVFSDRLSQAIAQARRHQTRFAVLFVDLDRFKNINDSLGHHIGDLLLREVAKRLLDAMRETDTVCRLGGDEFILLVQDIGPPEHVAAIAGKILTAISRPYLLEGNDLNLTPSIGIACYPQDGDDEESLVKNADAAMYHAKESGRGQYQFFTEQLNVNVHDRLSIENDLRKALARNEFVLHFQPKLDIPTRTIAGCEALIRWQHPQLGMISPARFIPIAEETGLIVAIGDWVLETACREGLRLQSEGFPGLLMSVNVAAPQLKKAGFVERVLEILKNTGLSPNRLELEVTESMIMHDVENVTTILQQLHDAGVQLAIDDFGTGYSSLAYLKRFPIHVLKIDQSFVRDIMIDQDDAAIVQAIVALAHSLRLGVVAEGVETQEQFDFLEAHGCNTIQGYLIARPLPVEGFIKLVDQAK